MRWFLDSSKIGLNDLRPWFSQFGYRDVVCNFPLVGILRNLAFTLNMYFSTMMIAFCEISFNIPTITRSKHSAFRIFNILMITFFISFNVKYLVGKLSWFWYVGCNVIFLEEFSRWLVKCIDTFIIVDCPFIGCFTKSRFGDFSLMDHLKFFVSLLKRLKIVLCSILRCDCHLYWAFLGFLTRSWISLK